MAFPIHSFNPDYRHCKRCGGDYPEECFDLKGFGTSNPIRRAVCNMCEQTAKDEKKRQNRWIDKARHTLRRHADKYRKLGYAITSTNDFASKFGWKIEKIAHDLQHAYDNQCRCGDVYKNMGHGLRDIQLDITDPSQPPYYTNTQPLCATCNSKKATTDPRKWGARMVGWDLWKQNQEKIKNGLMAGPELFECVGLRLPIQIKP